MPTGFDSQIKTIGVYGKQVIAPILLDYVEWILVKAQDRGLKRLYFLARDGHILCKLATDICRAKSLDIECRYLYCSRYTLRAASYGLISREEVLSLVGISSVECSPQLILERCPFTTAQKEMLALSCNISDLNCTLNKAGRLRFVAALNSCSLFWSFLQQESQHFYETTMAYFRQEGFLEGNAAIVDSGWSGSMQRSLGQLLRSVDFTDRLEGFYFGMYKSPKNPEDGIYHTFYFNHNGALSDKAWFSNNLFECMLSAPHGMTVGYEVQNGQVLPILQEKRTPSELHFVEEQQSGILQYAKQYLQCEHVILSDNERRARCRKNLRRYMVYPTIDEVELLSVFQFCDDSTEGYFLPLSEIGSLKTLTSRLFHMRVLRKITNGKFCCKHHHFVWYYGAVVGAPRWLQPLYRWNEFLWECIRLSL